MKNIRLIIFMLLLGYQSNAQQTNTQNYIISRSYRQAGADANDVSKVSTQVQYIDGLGRALQNVAVAQSPGGTDVVQPIAYDAAGRQSKKYLPYAADGNKASYRSNDVTAVGAWYLANTALLQAASPASLDLDRPFTETIFESSPLSRASTVQEPGTRSRSSAVKYQANGIAEVKRYDYDPSANTIVLNGDYPSGALMRTMYKDQQDYESNEYADVLGNVICKTVLTGTETLYTYYVYDDLGLLRGVLQPQFQDDGSLANSAFLYDYDEQGRMIKKQVPGGAVTDFVYDKYDRLVYSRSGNQKARNVWAFTKYDELNRPIVTGEISSAATPQDQAASVNSGTQHHESRSNGVTAGYSLNQTAPTSATEADLLTIMFYDDYAFSKPSGFVYSASSGYPATANTAVNSMVTGGRARELPGGGSAGNWLTNVVYYDSEYRPIQTVRQLYDMGTDAHERVSTLYRYDLAPVVAQQRTEQLVGGVVHLHIAENSYDHADRLLDVKETVTVGSRTKTLHTLAQRYNTLGQLQSRWFHAYTTAPGQFRTRTNYTNNMLGWLTNAKTWYQLNLGTDLPFYAFCLSYENRLYAQQYSNGNVTKMEWSGKGETVFTGGLAFTYDQANRLLSSAKPSAATYTYADVENGITYYKNGNIHRLTRAGAAVDNLTYNYTGNRLTSVSDASGNGTGVKAGTSSYSYDADGNMTSDGNRAATLTYNYLNLPKTVSIGTTVMTYDYDAAGNKYKYVADTLTVKYAGIFEYNGSNVFKRVALAAGQAQLAKALAPNADTLRFDYYVKDHLGNVRVVYDERGNILQQTGYYPFGLSIDRNNPVTTPAERNGVNRYLYNGKELQVGTGYVDYGARMYMPEIGRWGAVDPMAEKREWLSPYNYVQNNPLIRVDPDGAFDFVQRGDGSIYWDKNANSQATTKQGETYLGTSLNFVFNSYINNTFDGPQPPWGVTGDKLTSTINVKGNEAADGSLTSVDIKSSYSIGETGGIAMFEGRDYFPGLGDGQNKAIDVKGMKGGAATFEQHASVPGIEAVGLGLLGYDIVNVAQKATIGLSGNNLSVTAGTDVFPSATLSVNGRQLFQYNQPSFKATHGHGSSYTDNGTGGVVTNDVQRRPGPSFHIRYQK